MYDRSWVARVAIGAGALGLAVTMTACEGAGAKARNKKRSRAVVSSAPPKAPQPLNCTDPGGDVQGAALGGGAGTGGGRTGTGRGGAGTGAGGASRAPGWADLTSVSWMRTSSGATVVFTTAQPLTNDTGLGDAVYSTTFKQGIVRARVDARMAGGTWRVTSTGGGRSTTVLSLPVVNGRTITLQLPRLLAAGRYSIDLNRSVHVAAATRAHAGGPFRDPGCGAATPGNRPGQVLAWPGPGGQGPPVVTRPVVTRPVVTRPPRTARPRPPARTRTPSPSGPARTPTTKPRTRP